MFKKLHDTPFKFECRRSQRFCHRGTTHPFHVIVEKQHKPPSVILLTTTTNMTTTATMTPVATTTTTDTNTTTSSATSTAIPASTTTKTTDKPVWIRLNHKGIYHDNRRLLKHRAKNCECFICYREIYKLPPAETHEEYVSSLKSRMKEREIKRTKKLAKKEVKAGKQRTIDNFFQG